MVQPSERFAPKTSLKYDPDDCIKGPFGADQAVREFEKQFKSKTSANWADRKTMVRKNGEYLLVV